MTKIRIKEVASNEDLEVFLDLPRHIYQNNPNWVEPIRSSIKELLSSTGTFNKSGQFQAFIAFQDEVVVGRIVGAVNHALNDKEGHIIGLFGYLESINDIAVSNALFNAAKAWLSGFSCELLRGPIDLSTHINCLCLVDGFDSAPYLMMPYNPDYYPHLIEAAGMTKAKDAYAYAFETAPAMRSVFERGHKLASNAGIQFRPIRLKGEGFEEDCKALYRVYSQGFADNWSATPRSEQEFLAEAKDLRQIADPKLFPIAEFKGEVIGFFMCLPDFNMALRHAKGKLNLPGIVKILWHKRKINRARVIALCVAPEYQKRRLAVGPALIYLGAKGGKNRYSDAELSWVWEDNVTSRKLIEASGGKPYKTYRIYEQQIN